MAPKRPGEIERAQTQTHYPIGGELFIRIKYGDECFGWRAGTTPCYDCGVTKGQLHIPSCDVEECPNCHTQLLSCERPRECVFGGLGSRDAMIYIHLSTRKMNRQSEQNKPHDTTPIPNPQSPILYPPLPSCLFPLPVDIRHKLP
jgi:hypothetical protein